MLKDPKLLNKTLIDYLKTQLLISKKEGVAINLDGTLMSLINIYLAKQLGDPFKFKVVTCVFNQNKYALSHLISLIQKLEVQVEVRDLSKDLDTLSLYKNAGQDANKEIAIKKRFVDLAMNIEADKSNLICLSNLSYSQWCVGFPHKNYQNLEQVHLLNRLFYSEIQEFARFAGLPDATVDREPSHYLHRNQLDKKSLGFTYDELEDYLRNATQDRNHTDLVIKNRLEADNRHRFLNPTIQRPSNILG